MTTVDALLHEQQAAGARPVLLKIDVEGYEGLVLDGAREILVEAPLVLTEYAPEILELGGISPSSPFQLLLRMGFDPFVLTPTGPTPTTEQKIVASQETLNLIWHRPGSVDDLWDRPGG